MPETQKSESKVRQPVIHTVQPTITLAKVQDADNKRTHTDSVLQPVLEHFSTSDFRPGILELCAGSATLSSVAAAKGLLPVPVDYSRNKLNPKLPIIKLDLAEDYSVDICIDQIHSGSIQIVTAAVPCGTASRARDIWIPGGPLPLRSEDEPYGLSSLEDVDLLRVEKANRIYLNCQKILVAAHLRGCICILENPDRSYLWLLAEIIFLLSIGFFDVRFQHCRWTPTRAMRAKWSRLRVNKKKLMILDGPCTLELI